MPNNLIFVGISSVKPKRIYLTSSAIASSPLISYFTVMLNSMLALLNSREALRDIGKNDFGPVRVSELRASGYRSGAHLISPNKTQVRPPSMTTSTGTDIVSRHMVLGVL